MMMLTRYTNTDLFQLNHTNEIIEIWKMRDKKNETADIFKTVVEIYQSNFDLYRSCRSNKVGFLIKIVIRFNT